MVRWRSVETSSGELTTVVGHRHAGASPLEQHYLLVLDDDAPRVFPLPTNRTVMLGRGETACLRLLDTSVSRRHASIARMNGRIHVSDLESQNGTLVNGERIAEPRLLAPGDRVTVGGVTLIYQSIASARAAPATEPAARTLHIGDRVAIVADPAMVRLYELVERLATSELPVLVVGETGSGKDLAARALHQLSRRSARPFVGLNCAALQDSLVESELFGYERGAFSGATAAKPGLLETATGGTMFLDEVGDLPAAAQAKLLRVLETKRLMRLGDVRERAIDIRVIAATNRDLAADVETGRFRQDLFFRLSAATIAIPSLRDRPCELPLLADMFLRQACLEAGRAPMVLAPAAEARLLDYAWPGNVRELKHVMEYLAATAGECLVEPAHLDARLGRIATATPAPREAEPATEPPQFRPLADEIRELERTRITAALDAANGNQRTAARMLAMPLRTFVFKLRHYGLRHADR
jgi:two-component system response regulator AtoC